MIIGLISRSPCVLLAARFAVSLHAISHQACGHMDRIWFLARLNLANPVKQQNAVIMGVSNALIDHYVYEVIRASLAHVLGVYAAVVLTKCHSHVSAI
ncbi:hypothetical protein D3C80_1284300 [compost metagenome]